MLRITCLRFRFWARNARAGCRQFRSQLTRMKAAIALNLVRVLTKLALAANPFGLNQVASQKLKP